MNRINNYYDLKLDKTHNQINVTNMCYLIFFGARANSSGYFQDLCDSHMNLSILFTNDIKNVFRINEEQILHTEQIYFFTTKIIFWNSQ